jgi:peptidoglycan hydrolase-like protein with peptidoglycan-binding domain
MAMDLARLSDLYREASAEREDVIRASLAASVAQAAAAAVALEAAERPTLAVGKASPGADVRQLQLLLAARGVDVRVDGSYDKDTAKAVTEFQGSAGLEPTGVVDTATWSALSGVFYAAQDLAAQARALIESVHAGVSETLANPGDRVAESLAAESLAAESLAAEALAAESLALESTVAEPLAAEPLAAEPLAAEPLAAEPMAMEPLAAEPFAAEPLAAEPFAAETLAAETTAVGFLTDDAIGVALRSFIAEHNTEG